MTYLPFHIFFMSAALLCMCAGIYIAHSHKSKKWWLKAHKILNISAVVSALVGLIMGDLMVEALGGPNLGLPHIWIGAVTLILGFAMPILGFAIFKAKGKEKISGLKKWHRILGKTTLAGLVVTIVSGLLTAGIL